MFGPNAGIAAAGRPILPEPREINEHGREYYFKDKKISWDKL